MRPFVTDEMIVERLRSIESRLRARGLADVADDCAELACLLEPAPEAKP